MSFGPSVKGPPLSSCLGVGRLDRWAGKGKPKFTHVSLFLLGDETPAIGIRKGMERKSCSQGNGLDSKLVSLVIFFNSMLRSKWYLKAFQAQDIVPWGQSKVHRFCPDIPYSNERPDL